MIGLSTAWRSLLFAPADNSSRIAKAAGSDADAVILDLEDGVAPSEKPGARRALTDSVAIVRAKDKDAIVRINAPWLPATEDIAVAILAGASALMIPKVETGARLDIIGEIIGEHETSFGLEIGSTAIIALIESARGISAAAIIAAAPRVVALALGSEDFSLDLGVAPSPEVLDLPCKHLALSAHAAGIASFAMPISIAAYSDEDGIGIAARSARAFGAQGGLCIHPTQVRIINREFVATARELDHARAVTAAWQSASTVGTGVISVDGLMIDAPVAARAARLLAQNRQMEGGSSGE